MIEMFDVNSIDTFIAFDQKDVSHCWKLRNQQPVSRQPADGNKEQSIMAYARSKCLKIVFK